MNLTVDELEKAKKYNVYIPSDLTEENINNIRHIIKVNEFHETDEYKKIKAIYDRHYMNIFNLPDVVSVGLNSSFYYNTTSFLPGDDPGFYIDVMIEKLRDDLPNEVDGLKIKYKIDKIESK